MARPAAIGSPKTILPGVREQGCKGGEDIKGARGSRGLEGVMWLEGVIGWVLKEVEGVRVG